MGCGGSTTAQGPPGRSKKNEDLDLTEVTDDECDSSVYGNNIKSNGQAKGQVIQNNNTRPVVTTTAVQSIGKSPPGQVTVKPVQGNKAEDLVVETLEDESDLPAPRPSSKKKVEIVDDQADLQRIDDHVAKTPSSACASIPELVDYLTKTAKSSLQKVRAFHQWVTHNIRYDTEGFFSDNYKASDSNSVFRSRSSVCQGYSELFAAMCRCAHIPVNVISGYAKGYGYNPEETIDLKSKTNHAWNAVHLDGEWRLIDCTWDAGYVDDQRTFQWSHSDFYFLTDPEDFLVTHFPYIKSNITSSQRWQLVRKPIDIETFSKSLKQDKFALKNGIKPVSHPEGFVSVLKEIDIIIERPEGPLRQVSVRLRHSKTGEDYKQYVFVKRLESNRVCLTVRPPEKTLYKLQIFGDVSSSSGSSPLLFTYVMKCTLTERITKPYPEHHGIWGPLINKEDFGFDKSISNQATFESQNGEQEITLPTTRQVNVWGNLKSADDALNSSLENSVLIQYGVSSVTATVRMPKDGYYKLQVTGKAPDGSNKTIFSYLILCKRGLNPFSPFPILYDQAKEFQVTLIEPMSRTLPANSSVHFRFTSPLLTAVTFGSEKFQRQNGDVWDFDVQTGESGSDVALFGSIDNETKRHGIFGYTIQ